MFTISMIEGLLVIDKPKDWTSFDVVAKIRSLLGVKRVGHAGTLDPFATGLLLVAVGRATRLLEYMVLGKKEYAVTIHLGAISDTYDVTGNIAVQEVSHVPTREEVLRAVHEFSGTILQTPPAFSAVHVGGKRAYDLARAGQTVEIPPREVWIDSKITSYDWPTLQLEVSCSSGTYIRSLVHDIGKVLHVGGYAEELRRLGSGEYLVDRALPFSSATTSAELVSLLLPVVEMKLDLPIFTLEKERRIAFLQGKSTTLQEVSESKIFAVYCEKELLGIGIVRSNELVPKKVLLFE